MIKCEIIRKIRVLLKQDRMSQRQIAKNLGISRGTVQAVAHGRRTEHVPAVLKKRAAIWVIPSGKPKRCPHCGGCVKMPCLACQLYEMQQNSDSGLG